MSIAMAPITKGVGGWVNGERVGSNLNLSSSLRLHSALMNSEMMTLIYGAEYDRIGSNLVWILMCDL